MANVALLSNPNSTGNRAILPEVRAYCAETADVFHYEVDHVDEIAKALETIARVKPKVLVINGGDGTVQAALTELHQGGYFGETPPPVAVLPNGKTNLIALDLGAEGNPLKALERIVEMAKHDLHEHLVDRELIALSDGEKDSRVVLGMFLGGAGLSEFILYCRHKIYPLGLPNAAAAHDHHCFRSIGICAVRPARQIFAQSAVSGQNIADPGRAVSGQFCRSGSDNSGKTAPAQALCPGQTRQRTYAVHGD